MEIWSFNCSQLDFAAFGYGGLGILSKIELLVNGEHIFDLLWWAGSTS
jgi:hypothetical protein